MNSEKLIIYFIYKDECIIKNLSEKIEHNIDYIDFKNFKIHYKDKEPNIIIFDNINLNDILAIRRQNYNTKFIYLYDNFSLKNIYLFTSCRFSSVIEKSKLDINLLIKEINKVVSEIIEISNSFLLKLQDNYNWQSSSKTLYDNNFKVVDLIKSEQSVFEILVTNSNNILSLEMIQSYLEDEQVYIKKRSLQNIISNLRKKIPQNIIKNIYGEGYKIDLKYENNSFELKDLQYLSNSLDELTDEKEVCKVYCDILFDMFKSERSYVMYVNFNKNKIIVPFENSVDEYPGAAKLNIEIPITKWQLNFYKTIIKLSDPMILKYKDMKELPKESPFGVWDIIEIPKSALVFHFKIKNTIWMSGLHYCSHEHNWTKEEVIFLKHCCMIFEKKMNSL